MSADESKEKGIKNKEYKWIIFFCEFEAEVEIGNYEGNFFLNCKLSFSNSFSIIR